MNKHYRLVVFDWEGTISDTLGQVINCVAKEARLLNFGELDLNLARQSVELGLVKAVKRVYPHLSPSQHEQLLAAVHCRLQARTPEVHLIPGVKSLIEQLHQQGMHLAIASNKGLASLQRAIQAAQLEQFFTVIRSASTTPAKPCPQMLQEIIAEVAVEPFEALMIGDSVSDITMAKNVPVDALGFDFYHQQNNLLLQEGALAVFDNYQAVADFLQLSQKD